MTEWSLSLRKLTRLNDATIGPYLHRVHRLRWSCGADRLRGSHHLFEHAQLFSYRQRGELVYDVGDGSR